MRTIGLIGGMSWESSLEYYRLINEGVKAKLGGLHSAKCLLYSVDFAEIEPLQKEGRWDEAARLLIAAARSLEAGGADLILLCTNTMHKTADDVQESVAIPLLHIADATAEAIVSRGLKKVGLLGTRFTMEQDFYKGRLAEKHGLDVIVPAQTGRETVHRIIYDELCLGRIDPRSRMEYASIMEDLAGRGAEAIILGCTEIGLLVGPGECRVPLFDTTRIHAEAAVKYALRGPKTS
jgi:aspartate racemase